MKTKVYFERPKKKSRAQDAWDMLEAKRLDGVLHSIKFCPKRKVWVGTHVVKHYAISYWPRIPVHRATE